MPLANIPMIDYTLEFLIAGGVQDVIIVTSSHAEKIEQYLKSVL